MTSDIPPKQTERYYVGHDFNGYTVRDWYSRGGWCAKHSTHKTHKTREEAEAVALALNRLSE